MNEKLSIQETWDKIAFSFDKTRNQPWSQCIEFMEKTTLTKNFVDIGCGNGRHLIPSTNIFDYSIGVDLSKNLLKIINQKIQKQSIKNISLIHANAYNLPIKSNSVDTVLYIATLHNIKGRENRIKSLQEIYRILAKNGKAMVTVWSKWQEKFRIDFLKKWFKEIGKYEFGDIDIYWRQHGLNIPRFYHLYGKNEFREDLLVSKFRIVKFDELFISSKKYADNFCAIIQK